jgi:hypothetical protein
MGSAKADIKLKLRLSIYYVDFIQRGPTFFLWGVFVTFSLSGIGIIFEAKKGDIWNRGAN